MSDSPSRCPYCNSTNLASVETTSIDSQLLECQDCNRAYEVKYGRDGNAILVAVYRISRSFRAAIVTALVSFIAFFIGFGLWVEWRYSHPGSMASLVGFVYGVPISAVSGVIAYCLVDRKTKS